MWACEKNITTSSSCTGAVRYNLLSVFEILGAADSAYAKLEALEINDD